MPVQEECESSTFVVYPKRRLTIKKKNAREFVEFQGLEEVLNEITESNNETRCQNQSIQ
jgi:hypothetical protein